MSYLDTIVNDEQIWTAIVQYTLGKSRPGTGNFPIKINCPMCITRGTTPDTRFRCGIGHTPEKIGVNCFNCNFKARFVKGERLSNSMASFMERIGVPPREVKKYKIYADQIARLVEIAQDKQPDYVVKTTFAATSLPDGSKSLEQWADEGCDNPDYLNVVDYLLTRGEVVAAATKYYWTPLAKFCRRLIIPCLHNDRIVGWMGRAIDPETRPKYHKQTPKDFLFNAKCLTLPGRKYAFIVEGAFDALAIEGVAVMGANMNDRRIRWINDSGKLPVVVPDRDEAGKHLVSIAINQDWAVAIPNYGGHRWWDGAIKDVDEAVRHHGKLFVLRSIVASITRDRIAIKTRLNYSI